MKKLVAINLIVLVLITFVSTNVFATDGDGLTSYGSGESIQDIQEGITQDTFSSMFEKGTTSTFGEKKQSNVPIQLKGEKNYHSLIGLIVKILCLIPRLANKIIVEIVDEGNGTFTIENLITNKYELFNISYLIDSSSMKTNSKAAVDVLSKNVAIWFVSLRNLAAVASVLVLMYVGIRMLLATTAPKKAEYKKMLMSWAESVVLLFVLQFFIIAIVYASTKSVNFLAKAIDAKDANYVEKHLIEDINKNVTESGSGIGAITYLLLYLMLMYYQIKFFLLYFFRMIRFAFYIIISPLVCITYAIDKVGDGKAQAFHHLMIDIMITAFLQPIQLLIYLFFIFSAREILVSNMFLGLLFFSALGQGEKMVKEVLSIRSSDNVKGIDDINIKIKG